jgi:hypothetical protein
VAVFALSSTILLMCMWTSNTMRNPMFLKEGTQITIFTPPIGLNMDNFMFEEALNVCLELNKNIKHIRLAFK